MSKVIFKRKNTNEIENLKVQDGSLIFNTETGAIFMDYGTKRISIFDNLYPIGSIIIRDNDIDMSNYLGFTWTKVFAGKVLVGVDSTDNDFKTVGKTGGEKTHTLTVNEMPSHGHSTAVVYPYTAGADHTCTPNASKDRTGTAWDVVDKTGGDKPHNNLQPYQVVAYWKRIL